MNMILVLAEAPKAWSAFFTVTIDTKRIKQVVQGHYSSLDKLYNTILEDLILLNKYFIMVSNIWHQSTFYKRPFWKIIRSPN